MSLSIHQWDLKFYRRKERKHQQSSAIMCEEKKSSNNINHYIEGERPRNVLMIIYYVNRMNSPEHPPFFLCRDNSTGFVLNYF